MFYPSTFSYLGGSFPPPPSQNPCDSVSFFLDVTREKDPTTSPVRDQSSADDTFESPNQMSFSNDDNHVTYSNLCTQTEDDVWREWCCQCGISPTDLLDSDEGSNDVEYRYPSDTFETFGYLGDRPCCVCYGGDEIVYKEIVLPRSDLGLVLCAGATEGETGVRDVFISDIHPRSLTWSDGRCHIGDQILQINGVNVTNEDQAWNLLHDVYASEIRILLGRVEQYFESSPVDSSFEKDSHHLFPTQSQGYDDPWIFRNGACHSDSSYSSPLVPSSVISEDRDKSELSRFSSGSRLPESPIHEYEVPCVDRSTVFSATHDDGTFGTDCSSNFYHPILYSTKNEHVYESVDGPQSPLVSESLPDTSAPKRDLGLLAAQMRNVHLGCAQLGGEELVTRVDVRSSKADAYYQPRYSKKVRNEHNIFNSSCANNEIPLLDRKDMVSHGCDLSQSQIQTLYPKYADVMYTNGPNLMHTIAVQQHLFQKAHNLTQRIPKSHKKFSNSSSGSRLVDPDRAQEEKEETHEWVVKIRSDGSRYVTRRPVRSGSKNKERIRKRVEKKREPKEETTDVEGEGPPVQDRYCNKEGRRQYRDLVKERRRMLISLNNESSFTEKSQPSHRLPDISRNDQRSPPKNNRKQSLAKINLSGSMLDHFQKPFTHNKNTSGFLLSVVTV